MLTIFSVAEAKYFPVTLQDRGDRQGSLGDPRPDTPSSEELLLMRGHRKLSITHCVSEPMATCYTGVLMFLT